MCLFASQNLGFPIRALMALVPITVYCYNDHWSSENMFSNFGLFLLLLLVVVEEVVFQDRVFLCLPGCLLAL